MAIARGLEGMGVGMSDELVIAKIPPGTTLEWMYNRVAIYFPDEESAGKVFIALQEADRLSISLKLAFNYRDKL